MEQVYIFTLSALFALAIFDLVVGVSNDAVNFLNSAFSSRAARLRTIMIVASIGVGIGAIFSNGMMEIAKKGIFNPEMFYFEELMVIFATVMLADILLLDFFNTLGLPTSTTISIVFELLGASVGVAFVKELKEKDRLQTRLTEIEQEKTDITAEIEQVKSNKDAVQARFDKLSSRLAELKLQRTELTSNQRFEKNDLERLSEEKASLEKEQATLELLMEQKEQSSLQKVDITILEGQLEAAKQEKTELDQRLIRLKFELEDLEGQSDDIASRLEQARHQNEELIRRQAKAEAEKDKLMDVMRRQASNLTDDYQMSFDEASSQARPLESLSAAESQVKDLEKAIRALGPVNLEAVEQFEEVSNRLNFLNEQRDDVLSAKNLLLETIEEMNDEVKERFKSTFEAIRESFKVTFRQMFGGGSADLILTEGDLLTAGVEISVQPPGKKIQSLNLMSGGEKALSALALLFSIIRVKTIPFVILDEVEAALDEANVKRFGDYLNRFDKDSQFIVVTHRKGTMSAADSIYGVTMQESGVSKIVSVKLKDLESM